MHTLLSCSMTSMMTAEGTEGSTSVAVISSVTTSTLPARGSGWSGDRLVVRPSHQDPALRGCAGRSCSTFGCLAKARLYLVTSITVEDPSLRPNLDVVLPSTHSFVANSRTITPTRRVALHG